MKAALFVLRLNQVVSRRPAEQHSPRHANLCGNNDIVSPEMFLTAYHNTDK
jgi:hypothetical protein